MYHVFEYKLLNLIIDMGLIIGVIVVLSVRIPSLVRSIHESDLLG